MYPFFFQILCCVLDFKFIFAVKEIYVGDRTFPAGDGESSSSPFNNLIASFSKVSNLTASQSPFYFIIVSDFLTIVDSDVDAHINELIIYDSNRYNLFYTNNEPIDITILPLACYQMQLNQNNANPCVDKITISFKTERVFFLVSRTLNFVNIILSGTDLALNYVSPTDDNCYFSAECCNINAYYDNKINSRCYLQNSAMRRISSDFFNFSLFLINNDNTITNLTNCEINNFYAINLTKSYGSLFLNKVEIDIKNVSIYLNNSTISNCYFMFGLIKGYSVNFFIFSSIIENYNNCSVNDKKNKFMSFIVDLTNSNLTVNYTKFTGLTNLFNIINGNLNVTNSNFLKINDLAPDLVNYFMFLFSDSSSIFLKNLVFSNNSLQYHKNVKSFFYLYTNCNLTMNNVLFSNTIMNNHNISSFYSGNQIIIQNLFIYNVSGNLNSKSFCFSAIINNLILISDSNFTQVNFSGYGGSFYLYSLNILNVSNLTMNSFTSSDEITSYGSFCYYERSNNVTVNKSKITKINIHKGIGGIFSSDIYQKNILVIDNSSFSNIIGNIKGGFIYSGTGNNMTIINCEFHHISTIALGGVFYITSRNNLILSFSFFNSCKADSGGVIYAIEPSSIYINEIMTYNTFATNQAGVFYLAEVSLIINNSIFENSIGHQSIGGIYFYLNVEILLFNNIYMKNMSSLLGAAGSIYFESNSIANITNLIIDGSGTLYDFQPSGALFIKSNSSFIFNNCKFLSSFSLYDQGGVAYIGSDNNLTFNFGFFFNSSANRQGGVFSVEKNNAITFNFCEFHFSSCKMGGVFYINLFNLVVLNFSRISHSSGINGGAIFCNLNSKINIANTFFDLNQAETNGGDIYLYKNQTINLQNCSFANSFSQSSGGSFYLFTQNYLKINFVTFSNISSLSSGGIFEVSSFNSISITFINSTNITIENEGAFFNLGYLNNVSMNNLTLNSFSSSGAGFLQAFKQNLLSLSNISIKNGVSLTGAAVIIIFTWNTIIINAFKLENVTSLLFGGFTQMVFQNVLKIWDAEIYNVTSFFKAGVFFLLEQNQLLINNIVFQNIGTLNLGGGLLWAKSSNNVTFDYVVINNCKSKDSGGVFYLFALNILKVLHCNIYNVSTGPSGGGFIYLNYNNTAHLENSDFINIFAESKGGVMNIQSFNSLFTKNLSFEGIKTFNEYGGVYYFGQYNILSSSNCSYKDIFFDKGMFGIFVYANIYNSINIRNNSVETLNKSYENANMIFSFKNNSIYLENFEIKISYCFCLFYASQASYFSIYSFILRETIEVKTVFFLENSSLYLDYGRFNLKIHYSLIIASYSKISIMNFLIFPLITQTAVQINDIPFNLFNSEQILIKGNYSFLLLKNGVIKLKKNSKKCTGLLINRGIFKLIKTSIIGFQPNNVTDTITITDIEYLYIKKVLFLINRGVIKNGSVILINNGDNLMKTQLLKFSQSNFFFNFAENRGGCIYIKNSNLNNNFLNNQNFIVFQSNFERNKANHGGAIYMSNIMNVLIEKSSFSRNEALGQTLESTSNYLSSKAGAIYLENCFLDSTKSTILLQNNSFYYNKADIGGVIYHKGLVQTEIFNNSVTSNIAKFYGEFIASEPQTFYFLNDVSQNIMAYKILNKRLQNVISGFSYSSCLSNIAGVDSYSQITLMGETEYLSSLRIEDSFHNSLSLNLSEIYGFLCLSGPFLRQTLPISATKQYFISLKNSNLFLQISYRPCIIGERLADNLSCIECLRGEYIFNIDSSQNSPSCLICTTKTEFYCFGGNKLTPKPGYWRKNSNSLNFLNCKGQNCLGDPRDFNDENTVYNEYYSTGICQVGYQGVLCNDCVEGYGKVGDNLCEECNNFNYFGVILLFTFTKIMFSILCTHFIYYMGLDLYNSEANPPVQKKNIIISNLLKIWINHIEIMATILFFPINWSNYVKETLKYLFLISLKVGDSLPFECLRNSLRLNQKVMYFRLLMTVIYPFVLIFINFLYVLILSTIRKRKKHPKVEFYFRTNRYPWLSCLPNIFFAILLLCYSDIMKICLEMVQFINIGDYKNSDYRLVSDGSVVFNSPEYLYWFLRLDLPLITFYGVLFPISIFGYLFYKYRKNTLFNPLILFKFSLFFYSYEGKFLFWEIIIIIRKAISVFIQLYTFSSSNYKDLYPIITMMTVLLIATGMQTYFRPYKSQYDDLNNIEFHSLLSLTATFYLGIFYSMPNVLGVNLPDYYNYIFIILGGGINLTFLIKIIRVLFKFIKLKKPENFVDDSMKINISSEGKSSFFNLKTCTNNETSKINSNDISNHEDTYYERRNEVLSVTEDNRKSKVNLQCCGMHPLQRPLTVIDEQISQEKIYKTFLDVKMKVKNIKKKIQKKNLRNILQHEKTISVTELIEQNKQNYNKINEKMGENYNNDNIFEFLEQRDSVKNEKFNSSLFNFVFLFENSIFFDACLNNDQVFITTNFFQLKSSYSLGGDLDSLAYVKLVLTFTSVLEISEFEIDVKKHSDLILSFNPEINNMIVNTEKNIEFYFIALNIFDHPPEATIYAKLGRNKYINLIFKLPILMNRFLILETELDISEFKIKWDDDEYSELIINNVKRKAVSNFEHLCKLFEYHLILGEKKIAGIIKFLNRKKIFLDFIIDYEEKESIINLKFCFGVAKKIKNNEKIFLKSMIDKLNMLFEKILKFDPLYD